jgi:hypothetical protein
MEAVLDKRGRPDKMLRLLGTLIVCMGDRVFVLESPR